MDTTESDRDGGEQRVVVTLLLPRRTCAWLEEAALSVRYGGEMGRVVEDLVERAMPEAGARALKQPPPKKLPQAQ